jgi:UDP-glucuronate decarboxylase
MMRMMSAPDTFIGPVNLGNPDEFTIEELARQVIEITGSKSKIIHQPLPQDDPTRRRPDITLAKRELSWQPSVALREGLTKTIAWFRSIQIADYRPPTPNF